MMLLNIHGLKTLIVDTVYKEDSDSRIYNLGRASKAAGILIGKSAYRIIIMTRGQTKIEIMVSCADTPSSGKADCYLI